MIHALAILYLTTFVITYTVLAAKQYEHIPNDITLAVLGLHLLAVAAVIFV